jgi:hypothetical protein
MKRVITGWHSALRTGFSLLTQKHQFERKMTLWDNTRWTENPRVTRSTLLIGTSF